MPIRVTAKQLARLGKPAKAPVPRESEIQRAVVEYLVMNGAVVVRVNGGAVKLDKRFIRFAFVFAPGCKTTEMTPLDLQVTSAGVSWWCEVKRPGAKLLPGQRRFCEAVERHGGRCAVLRSVADAERLVSGGPMPAEWWEGSSKGVE